MDYDKRNKRANRIMIIWIILISILLAGTIAGLVLDILWLSLTGILLIGITSLICAVVLWTGKGKIW
jgi:CHASE2 domain-containing sensor protein